MLRRIVGDPLFVFAVAGVALFVLYKVVSGGDAEPVQLTAETRATLIRDFEAIAGRRASAEDLARIEHDYIADELLFRDAIASGLHLTDGMVRGRLVEVMRLRAAGELPEPTPEQLVNHYSEHLDRYRSEPAASFEQVYFSAPPAEPATTLAALRAGRRVAGEPFPQGERFPSYGRSMLRGLLGQSFVEALWAAPIGQWTGPIQSLQGWHYVLVTERLPPALLPFDEVREQVETDFVAAAIQDAVDRRVAELEQRYEVRVERNTSTGVQR